MGNVWNRERPLRCVCLRTEPTVVNFIDMIFSMDGFEEKKRRFSKHHCGMAL